MQLISRANEKIGGIAWHISVTSSESLRWQKRTVQDFPTILIILKEVEGE